MIIHSKYRDYYDTILSHGRDDSLHFIREFRELPEKPIFDLLDNLIPRNHIFLKSMQNGIHVVGFCGKLYFGIYAAPYITESKNNKLFWPHNNWKGLEEEFSNSIDTNRYNRDTLLKLIKFSEKNSGMDFLQYFIDNKIAYFSARGAYSLRYVLTRKCIGNAILKDLNFQVVKPPLQAMQELSMFLGGVIPRQAIDVVEISDTDRIMQHGFNKYSFRHPIK
jgi:hypothetical protein